MGAGSDGGGAAAQSRGCRRAGPQALGVHPLEKPGPAPLLVPLRCRVGAVLPVLPVPRRAVPPPGQACGAAGDRCSRQRLSAAHGGGGAVAASPRQAAVGWASRLQQEPSIGSRAVRVRRGEQR